MDAKRQDSPDRWPTLLVLGVLANGRGADPFLPLQGVPGVGTPCK
mgnify:CR=1 FL=1|jgi:hypothetical protein